MVYLLLLFFKKRPKFVSTKKTFTMKNLRPTLIRSFLLSAITLFISLGTLSAQGWEKSYNGVGVSLDRAFDVVSTSDGNMILAAFNTNGPSFGNTEIFLRKFDTTSNIIWTTSVPATTSNLGGGHNSLAPTNDGGAIFAEGKSLSTVGFTYPKLWKLDTDGNLEWEINYSTHFESIPTSSATVADIIQLTDGNYLFSGRIENGEPYLLKADALGNIIWYQQFNIGWYFNKLVETAQQEILIGGSANNGMLIIKTDATGNIIWTQTHVDETYPRSIAETSDGSIMMGANNTQVKLDNQGNFLWSKELPVGSSSRYIPNEGFIFSSILVDPPPPGFPFDMGIQMARTDMDGNVIWHKKYNYRSGEDQPRAVTPTADGGFVTVGYTGNPINAEDIYIIKTDENGNVYDNEISGRIKLDENQDCIFDIAEPSLANWIVTATNSNRTYSTLSDDDGKYFLSVDLGDFEVTLIPPIDYWSVCSNNIQLNYSTTSNKDTINFLVQSIIDCPYLEIGSAIPFIRPCFDDSPYKISYCNNGTTEAQNAYIEVIFDSEITPISSTVPWTSQNGDTLIFELGNIAPGVCGDIQMELMLSCDATLGAAYCIESHIYPDSLCSPPSANWNGAFIEVSGVCQDSSVIFQIDNTGPGGMTQDGDYIIVEDAVLIMMNNFNLGSGQSSSASLPANGSTYILMSTQEPFAPGNPYPVASLEGCGTNGSGTFSVSYLNQFSQGDNDPFVDIDCREATSSFDPNDKQGFPTGFDDEHFIEPNTDLEYLIRFQNTGTDTAFTVVVRDTLSDLLDFATIRQGVGSHDYQLKIIDGNILEFTFSDIMLPDSNINEIASHGFIEFTISQKRDLPLGSIIKNKGAIYFDFNAPIITNETFHTIGLDFVTVSLQNPIQEENRIHVYPNPLQDFAIFEMKKEIKDGLIEIYDISGKLAWQQKVSGKQFELKRNDLKSGIYFYKITDGGQAINSGKIVVN